MSGAEIAAEVAAALIEAGEATGTGAYTCTIKRAGSVVASVPWEVGAGEELSTALHEVNGIEVMQEVRDMTGAGIIKRMLMVDAAGVEPLKSDVIAVGVAKADVAADTVFEEILAVRPLAPAGTVLYYTLELNI